MFKKAAVFLLLAVLVISTASCKPEKKQTTDNLPSYVQGRIAESIGINMTGGGKLNYWNNTLIVHCYNNGSHTYKVLDLEGKQLKEATCSIEGDGAVFAIDRNNTLYVLVQNPITDAKTKEVTEIELSVCSYDLKSTSSAVRKIGRIPAENGRTIYARDMAVDQDGAICILNRAGTIEVFPKDSSTPKKVGSNKYTCIGIDSNNSIIAGGANDIKGSPFIQKLDISSGRTIWSKTIERQPLGIIFNSSDYFYIYDSKGITQYDMDGNFKSMLMDFNKSYIGDINDVSSVNIDNESNIYVTLYDEAFIYKYTPATEQEESLSTNTELPSTKLKLYITGIDETESAYRFAISNYKKAHPNIDIEVNEYSEAERSLINASIMAGDGPDIIEIASFMPYFKFISKGVLTDINSLLMEDKSFDINTLFSNIIDSYKVDGKIYSMPVNYSFNVIIANNSLLDSQSLKIDDTAWTWKDFVEACSKTTHDSDSDTNPDVYALSDDEQKNYISFNILLRYILENNFDSFVDINKKESSFDSQEFISILEQLRYLYEKQAVNTQGSTQSSSMQSICFRPMRLVGYATLWIPKTLFGTHDISFYRIPGISGQSNTTVCIPDISLAITENTKHKIEAWEFVKTMLSKEVQLSEYLGLPVNKLAYEEKAKHFIDESKLLQNRLNVINENDINQLNNLIKNCTKVSQYDSTIIDLAISEAMHYYSGEISAQEAAKKIHQKVTTYLNE